MPTGELLETGGLKKGEPDLLIGVPPCQPFSKPGYALEFRLLRTFLERPGRVQSRETLLSDVWGISAEVTTRTVDTHIKRLREKLGAAGEILETP